MSHGGSVQRALALRPVFVCVHVYTDVPLLSFRSMCRRTKRPRKRRRRAYRSAPASSSGSCPSTYALTVCQLAYKQVDWLLNDCFPLYVHPVYQVIYTLVRFVWYHDTVTRWTLAGYLFLLGTTYLSYSWVVSAAEEGGTSEYDFLSHCPVVLTLRSILTRALSSPLGTRWTCC